MLGKKNYSNANYSRRYTSPSMFIRLRALYFDVNKQFFQPGLLPDPLIHQYIIRDKVGGSLLQLEDK